MGFGLLFDCLDCVVNFVLSLGLLLCWIVSVYGWELVLLWFIVCFAWFVFGVFVVRDVIFDLVCVRRSVCFLVLALLCWLIVGLFDVVNSVDLFSVI